MGSVRRQSANLTGSCELQALQVTETVGNQLQCGSWVRTDHATWACAQLQEMWAQICCLELYCPRGGGSNGGCGSRKPSANSKGQLLYGH